MRAEHLSRLMANSLYLYILRGVNVLVPAIALPFLVRALGVERYGTLAFARGVAAYVFILSDLGFTISATREISAFRDDERKVEEIFNSVLFIKLAVFLVLSVLFFLISSLAPEIQSKREVISLYLASSFVSSLFPFWFFQGREQMEFITLFLSLARVVYLVLVVALVRSPSDYKLEPAIALSSNLIATAAAFTLILKGERMRIYLPSLRKLLHYLKMTFPFFLSRLSVSLYTASNVVLLGLFTSDEIVGYYSIAEKLYLLVRELFKPVSQALYPFMARERELGLFKRLFLMLNVVSLGMFITLESSSKFIFQLLFPQVPLLSLKLFKLMNLANLFVVPSIFLGYPFLAAMGYPDYANLSTIYGSVIYFVIVVLLILLNKVSPLSLSLSIIVTELAVFLFRVYWAREVLLRWGRR